MKKAIVKVLCAAILLNYFIFGITAHAEVTIHEGTYYISSDTYYYDLYATASSVNVNYDLNGIGTEKCVWTLEADGNYLC